MNETKKPFMIGNKAAVTAYIDLDTFQKIEHNRGLIGRSAFLGSLIENALNEKETCEA